MIDVAAAPSHDLRLGLKHSTAAAVRRCWCCSAQKTAFGGWRRRRQKNGTLKHPPFAARDARKQVAWALGAIDNARAVPALLTALRDASAGVRHQAAWALGAIDDARAVDALVSALQDSDASTREEHALLKQLIRFWAASSSTYFRGASCGSANLGFSPTRVAAGVSLARTLLATPSSAAPSTDATPTVTDDTMPRATWACPRCGAAMIVGPILSALRLASVTLGFDTS